MPSTRKLHGKVLVLGEDTRSFLAVVRSLGRAGLEVHTAWTPLNCPTLVSKYVVRNHALPAYTAIGLEWLDAFCDLLRRENFNLVFPCSDGSILPLQLHRGRIEPFSTVVLLADEVYGICASKAKTHAIAEELGIALPRQIIARSVEELRAAAALLGFPAVLKAETSASAANPFHRAPVVKVRNEEELLEHGKDLLNTSPVLVEQNAPGSGVGVEFLAKDGAILTAFQHERIHEMPGGGRSGYRRSVALDPQMYDAAQKLAARLNYTGLAMVEFKQDLRTGRWALLEINARVWGSIALSIAAGLDFPRYLYELLIDGRTEFPTRYRTNLYCRHWTADLDWLRANAEADPNDPRLHRRPALSIAAEFWNIVALRERSDTFQTDDLAPAFNDLAQYFGARWFGLLKRMRSYRVLEGRRAAKAFRNARRVLVICHGNICRSPFAEKQLQAQFPDLEIASAGCHPQPDRSSPEEAIQAAEQLGVDLAVCRSSVVDSAMMARADLVFIFDNRNWEEISERFAGFEQKTHYLGSLDPGGPLEIADPYGAGVDQFSACYTRIRRAITRLGEPSQRRAHAPRSAIQVEEE